MNASLSFILDIILDHGKKKKTQGIAKNLHTQ